MRAMVCEAPGAPLVLRHRPEPMPGPGQVRLRVHACGVCRTDLHVVDGDLAQRRDSVIPGHEIVGRVEAVGADVTGFTPGQRIGVPWLGWTCGACDACRAGRENLCERAGFTGWTLDGGYAEMAVADARYCFPLPEGFDDLAAAPLLCAGLIGYRAWRAAGDPSLTPRLGLYGFGAAAHLLAQVAIAKGQTVHAFTRTGDTEAQAFAMRLGCASAGAADAPPPEPLDAAILFAPVGALVPTALAAVRPGGTVVCAGIHMSDIPAFPYRLLWGERRVVSVANLTRADGHAFLALAAQLGLRPAVTAYPLAEANRALDDLRRGALAGAAVLVPS